jgi:hypothetical protein
MLDRREVVVVNPEPVMPRSANPQLPFDAPAHGHRNEVLRSRKETADTQQNAADESTDRTHRASSKAAVSWTQIPEIWAALERRFV